MRRQDAAFLSLGTALILGLSCPAWYKAQTALANFGDLYLYHYPMRHLVFSSLQAGRLPFWNPYIFSGLPLAANSQSALFYPPALLGAFFPLTLAFSWEALFHLLWSALGMALLARRSGLGAAAGWLLAALYSLSPFVLYRVAEGIPTLLGSLSWAPWCWLAWLSGWRGFLAAAWALQFLSGHPQFLVVNALGMGVWALARGGRERSRAILGLLAEGLGAAALACLQGLMTWEFLRLSVRQDLPHAFTTAYSADLSVLGTWLYPDAWGNPWDRTFAGPPSIFFETTGVYIGVIGLGLAGVGFWKGRFWPALALVGLGFFLALGGNNPFYGALLDYTPLGWLRTPSRYLFLPLWGLILAAGAGLRWLGRRGRARWKVLLLVLAVADLAFWARRSLKAEGSGLYLAVNEALAERIGGSPWRVLTDPDMASPNKAMLYRAMNVNGYEAFYLGGYPEYAARSEGRAAADPSRTYLRRHDSPEMSRLGVKYYIAPSGRIQENRGALPLAYFVDAAGSPLPAAVEVSIERPERWRIRGRVPAGARRLVASQPLYPGWRARLDGAPVPLETWDGLLQSVALPSLGSRVGAFDLSLDFRPRFWLVGVLVSVLAWGCWLLRAFKIYRL